MIYQLLTDRILYPNLNGTGQTVVQFELNLQRDIVFINNSQNKLSPSAYFLPWKENTGLSIDLPQTNPNATFFFTPILTGCCIGVVRDNNNVKIIHANDFDGHMPQEVIETYGNNVAWLITQHLADEWRERYKYAPMMSVYPDADNRGTTFWGEYEGSPGQWRFYYQDDNNEIHKFLY